MYRALMIAIVAVVSVFLGIVVFMVLARASRGLHDLWARRRRVILEPLVVRDIAVEGRTVDEALLPVLRTGDRRLLRRILLDHAQVVRGVARERLSRALEALGFVGEWIEGLRSPRWWKRAEAAENLALARSARSIEPLVARLEDRVPEVRLRAARALGSIRGHAAIRPLVSALSQPDRWSTIRIGDILTEAGREAAEELIDAWDDLTPAAQLAAIDILGQVRDLSAVPFLRKQLQQAGDENVRARAAHALGAIGDPEARQVLVRALGDSHWPVRAMAAKALGRIGEREAASDLAGSLADSSWWVRANAAEALRALGETGLWVLVETVGSEDRYASEQAIMVLEGEVELMAETFALGSGEDQERAGAFLRTIHERGRGELLRSIIVDHPRDEVRRALADLIAAPTGGGGAP
jgi:HEAT repeat protein